MKFNKFRNWISNLRLKLGLDILFSDFILTEIEKLFDNEEFFDKLMILMEEYGEEN